MVYVSAYLARRRAAEGFVVLCPIWFASVRDGEASPRFFEFDGSRLQSTVVDTGKITASSTARRKSALMIPLL
jgi:hypothetical protein